LAAALLSGLLMLAVILLAAAMLATLPGLLALLLAWLLWLLLAATLLAALLSLTALILIHAVLRGCPSTLATVQNPTRSLRFRRCQTFVHRICSERSASSAALLCSNGT
jgi:hypothetical protein